MNENERYQDLLTERPEKNWLYFKCLSIKKKWKQQMIKLYVYWLEHLTETKSMDMGVVQPADVIWCQMPVKEEALYKIPPGHRVRPFVILSVDEHCAKGYSCSSAMTRCIPQNRQFMIDHRKYHIDKSSYVDTTKVWDIPYDHMISCFYTITEDDFQALKQCSKNPLLRYDQNSEFGVGSVVKVEQQLYYIYQYDQNHYLAHPLYCSHSKRKKMLQLFKCKGNIYSIDYKETLSLSIDQQMEKIMQLSKEEIHEINCKKQASFEQQKKLNDVSAMKKEIHIEYKIGQCFQDENQNTFVYLYHKKEKAYGVYRDEYSSGYILRKQFIEYMNMSSIRIDDTEMNKILMEVIVNPVDKELIAYVRKLYQQQQKES